MKKQLHFWGFLIGSLLLSGAAYSQIDYSENFDGDETWPTNEFAATNEFPCEGDSYRVMLYGGFIPNMNAETVSETIGTSNGMEAELSYDYKIVLTSDASSPAQNENDWGNFTLYYGTSEDGPWTMLEAVNTTNHEESASCATRTVSFTPPADSDIYLKIIVNLGSPMNQLSFYFDNFTVVQEPSVPCETEAPEAPLEQTLCAGSTIEDLEAEGDMIIWYASEEAEEPLAEGTVLEDDTLYFAAQIPDGGCESEDRTKVTAFLTVIDEPEVEMTTQTFCGETFADDLDAEETVEDGELVWYDAETGGNMLGEEDELEDGEVYYVAQAANGCESARIPVTVEINFTEEPEAVSPQVFTGDDTLAIELYEDVEVTAEGTITWYATEEDAENEENALPNPTVITEPGTYYVTQMIDGCEGNYLPVEIQMILGNGDFIYDNFLFYPNPIENILTLSYSDRITGVEVINMLGQVVKTTRNSSNILTLDMSDLTNGCYFVKVTADEATHSIKVFKN